MVYLSMQQYQRITPAPRSEYHRPINSPEYGSIGAAYVVCQSSPVVGLDGLNIKFDPEGNIGDGKSLWARVELSILAPMVTEVKGDDDTGYKKTMAIGDPPAFVYREGWNGYVNRVNFPGDSAAVITPEQPLILFSFTPEQSNPEFVTVISASSKSSSNLKVFFEPR